MWEIPEENKSTQFADHARAAAEDEFLALQGRVEALIGKWEEELTEYPVETSQDAYVAATAVRLCIDELKAVIA